MAMCSRVRGDKVGDGEEGYRDGERNENEIGGGEQSRDRNAGGDMFIRVRYQTGSKLLCQERSDGSCEFSSSSSR